MAYPSDVGARVLVTGLTGFTGRYVAASLRARGMTVIDGNAVAGKLDLTDRASVDHIVDAADCEYVVHLAAVSFVAHADPVEFYRVNTVGTINLLEAVAAARRPTRKVLIASSANIYGNCPQSPIGEDVVPAPVNHYGCSKLAMEHLVRQWFARLPIVVTRPFNYTGCGQAGHFLVPKIVRHFAERAPQLELGNLEVTRDFSDVRDVAEACVSLLTAQVTSEVVNICSGVGWSLGAIVGECERLTGHRPEISVNPAFVRADEVKTLLGSRSKLDQLVSERPAYDFSATLEWMLSVGSGPQPDGGCFDSHAVQPAKATKK